MLTYKIYGLHTRDELIHNLKQQLDLDDSSVYYDDRPNGGLAIYTAKKAWLAPIEPGETHRVVFPDDIEVCDRFCEISTQITVTHPEAIISLFCWRGLKQNDQLENLPTPYIKSKLVIGAGIIMPVQYIQPCFDWIKETYNDEIADDLAIQYWAEKHGISVITTIPSLVQHLGDDSILDPNALIRRSAYFNRQVSPEIDWTNKEVVDLYPKIDFSPKGPNVIKVYV